MEYPIINGTVTINEYGAIRNLPGATVIINSTSGRTLAIATTNANGFYSTNFYSTDTQFKVTTSYLGCNSITNTVNVALSTNPNDPNYYGTSNAQRVHHTSMVEWKLWIRKFCIYNLL